MGLYEKKLNEKTIWRNNYRKKCKYECTINESQSSWYKVTQDGLIWHENQSEIFGYDIW